MTRRCVLLPASVCADALERVLNMFGPPRFSVAKAPVEASSRDMCVDLLVLVGLPALDVCGVWRDVCGHRGGVSAVDVRKPLLRLLGPIAQRDADVRPLPETGLFLTSVFHQVFQHEYLSNGHASLCELASEYRRWLALWRKCGVAVPKPTNRKMNRLPHLVGLAQDDPEQHLDTLQHVAGTVYSDVHALATAQLGG